MRFLNEVCANCGLRFGSHCAKTLLCPATEEGIDFKQGPGTIFKPTGEFKDGKQADER